MRTVAVITSSLALLMLSGCATTLRCGTDGDSSYVDLASVRDIPVNARHYRDLCGFNYAGEENGET